MDPTIAALLGVIAGAAASAGTALLLLRRAADRDLLERRLRALIRYREILGPCGSTAALEDGAELEQVLVDMGALAREFRLTAWIFDEPLRKELGRPLTAIEEEIRRSGATGERPAAVAVLAGIRELDRALRGAAVRCLREHRRRGLWPRRPREDTDEVVLDLPSLPLLEARGEDAAVR